MRKIPTLFARDFKTGLVTSECTPGLLRVFHGEARATRKWDGTACLFDLLGAWWRRYDAKKGKPRPEGFIACGEPDPVTGHDPGWLRVGDGPQDQWARMAIARGLDYDNSSFVNGSTYELCGPKLQGNPDGLAEHVMVRHGNVEADIAAMKINFTDLRDFLAQQHDGRYWEGIVFWLDDAPACKIKRRDFGLPWPIGE